MRTISFIGRVVVCAASIVSIFGAERSTASPVQLGSNYYEFVLADSISWADANAAASSRIFLGLNGHLATVTSAAENNFLATNVADFSSYEGLLALAWLGATVDSSGIASWVVGPEAGQQFSNGQTPLFGRYTNWGGVEPNNAPSAVQMHVGTLDWFGITHGMWGDSRNGLSDPCPGFCDPIVGYFVEYENVVTPLPAAMPLFATGLGGLRFMIWRRRRRH